MFHKKAIAAISSPANAIVSFGKDFLSGPDQPAAPDYTGAAEKTAAGNLEASRVATTANRPNQNTPWGSMTWQQDPSNQDKWTQNVTLAPGQQQLFDINQQSDIAQSKLGLMGIGQAESVFSSPFTLDSMGKLQNYGDKRQAVEEAMMSRVNTDIARDRETTSAQLIAQGIPPGSEAYNRQMEQLDRKQTDARQQAEIAATAQTKQMQEADIQSRRQTITEMLTERQTPLNEVIGWRGGTQVQSPQFGSFSQQQGVPGADYMGATSAEGNWNLAGWNADTARQNQILGGLFDIGAAAAGKG